MESATPVYRAGLNKGKPSNLPEHPPPAGYVCFRCGEKGHWIQECPTNSDPAFEGRQRVKRTTGIPRSFLKTVEKPSILLKDGTVDNTKRPAGIMVNAEGEWVVAEPDKASWDQYQAKAKVSAAAQEAAARGSKELKERGLECPIDKRLFVEPTQTPCCQITFCHECITNALLENDLRCPECCSENILIDDLTLDENMNAKIHRYVEERSADRDWKITQDPFTDVQPPLETGSGASPLIHAANSSSPKKTISNDAASRKRPAESDLDNERTRLGLISKAAKPAAGYNPKPEPQAQQTSYISSMPGHQLPPFSNESSTTPHDLNSLTFSSMNGYMGVPRSFGPSMGMTPTLQNPMMVPNGSFMGNDWSNVWSAGFPQQSWSMTGNTFNQATIPIGAYDLQNTHSSMGGSFINGNGVAINGTGTNKQGTGSFANQPRTTFSAPSTIDEDSAYFRKPVNPHRHQARRNTNRPTDYREI